MDANDRARFERWLHGGAACAVATAVAGVFSSFRVAPEARTPTPVLSRPGAAEAAPTYRELREARRGDNRLRHPDALAETARERPALTDPWTPSDLARSEALARRGERRAYEGAPPTVPHPIDQGAYPNCTACHAEGMVLAGRTAPAMPHAAYASCTQCHVVSTRPMPGEPLAGGPPVDNTFQGLEPPQGGERAWPGAPPTIPHRTLMRERCDSCHGVLSAGIRSSHPWRQSCQQCHAPSAELDQRPIFEPAVLPSIAARP